MNIEDFRDYCLSVKGATESLPFMHHNELVFKVMDKMFAFIALNPKDGIFIANLKCNPDHSIELRERYSGINPGHHPSTLLWNGVTLNSDVPDKMIEELILHSVEEVIKKLPKYKQDEYRNSSCDNLPNKIE